MPDALGHVATRRDDLHTMPLRQLELQIHLAGIVMSRRQIMRHCKAGTFDAQKLPAANNVEEWFIAPASVEKGIADIRTLQAHRVRHDATRRVMSSADEAKNDGSIHPDILGHDATRRDVSDEENKSPIAMARSDMSRHVATLHDIYEHPYVKRLEAQVDKLEKKYDDQVRRTEEIQLKGQQQLLELQRMTAVGQSETLANFMLKARNWVLGQPSDTISSKVEPPVDNSSPISTSGGL